MRGRVTAFLDEESEIEGRYTCAGTVVFDAKFSGEITSKDTLIIGERGVVHANVQAVNLIGSVTQTVPLTIDSKAPQLQLVSRKPVKIRSSEAATLTITADGQTITARAKPGVRRISVGGRRVVVFATDAAGNRSPTLRLR